MLSNCADKFPSLKSLFPSLKVWQCKSIQQSSLLCMLDSTSCICPRESFLAAVHAVIDGHWLLAQKEHKCGGRKTWHPSQSWFTFWSTDATDHHWVASVMIPRSSITFLGYSGSFSMLTKSTACTCITMCHALVVFRVSVIIGSLTVRLGWMSKSDELCSPGKGWITVKWCEKTKAFQRQGLKLWMYFWEDVGFFFNDLPHEANMAIWLEVGVQPKGWWLICDLLTTLESLPRIGFKSHSRGRAEIQ